MTGKIYLQYILEVFICKKKRTKIYVQNQGVEVHVDVDGQESKESEKTKSQDIDPVYINYSHWDHDDNVDESMYIQHQ